MPLLIEGRIINYDSELYGQVAIDENSGEIVEVGESLGKANIKTEGLIFPGFIDLHVHARQDISGKENYKEDFTSASAAAVNGGIVHIAEMPNNPVAPVDDIRYLQKQALTAAADIGITLYAGIGPGTHPLSFPVPYKVFMGPSVGDLFFKSQKELEEVIKNYQDQAVSFHCEDPEILLKNKGALSHEERRPKDAEVTATDFALYLTEKYSLKAKLCHYSTKEGLKKVIAAKARGVNVTCEVTPHHLFFDRTMLNDKNRLWLQMNPPLREPEDRIFLLERLRAGDIDYLATDHAPHTKEEKQKGVSGVPHLDTYGAFVTWLILENNFKPQDAARFCAFNPGQFINPFLGAKSRGKYGKIEKGYKGSLTILNLRKPTIVEAGSLKTKSGWSPFSGISFPGTVECVIIEGRVFKS